MPLNHGCNGEKITDRVFSNTYHMDLQNFRKGNCDRLFIFQNSCLRKLNHWCWDWCLYWEFHDRAKRQSTKDTISLLWCHNGCDGVSNHQPHDCLLNRSFRRRSKKTAKLRVTDDVIMPGTIHRNGVSEYSSRQKCWFCRYVCKGKFRYSASRFLTCKFSPLIS